MSGPLPDPVRRSARLGTAATTADRPDRSRHRPGRATRPSCPRRAAGPGLAGDLRADERVVQGSRTYVPVIPEHEWYRAEADQVEVFAPLVPVERVWVETVGGPAFGRRPTHDKGIRLVSLDGPTHPDPHPGLRGGRGQRPTGGARRGLCGTPRPSRGDRVLLRCRRRHLRPGHPGVGVVPLGLAWAAAHHAGGPGPPAVDRMSSLHALCVPRRLSSRL